jgi:hypothetical protein
MRFEFFFPIETNDIIIPPQHHRHSFIHSFIAHHHSPFTTTGYIIVGEKSSQQQQQLRWLGVAVVPRVIPPSFLLSFIAIEDRMDVLLFTLATAAYCCFYTVSSQTASKQQREQRRHTRDDDDDAVGGTTTSRTQRIIQTKPLAHFVQDWIRDFPHLATVSSLRDMIVFPNKEERNDAAHHQEPSQRRQRRQASGAPRVVGLLIDTTCSSSSSANDDDDAHAKNAVFASSLLLERAVAAVNISQKGSRDSLLKIVYIDSDWGAENNNGGSVQQRHHDFYKPVSFGVSAFTHQRNVNDSNNRDLLLTLKQLLQASATTIMAMFGMRNADTTFTNSNTSKSTGAATTPISTTTSLKVVHAVTGKVLTQEGFHHIILKNSATRSPSPAATTATTTLDGSGSSHSRTSNSSSSSSSSSRSTISSKQAARRRAAANPQDNWIEIS